LMLQIRKHKQFALQTGDKKGASADGGSANSC